jgi:hypothetical protein
MSASMSFRPDSDADVICHDYGTQRTPILTLWAASVSLTISGSDNFPLADHVAFARDLAAKTAAYLAALERYAAAQTDQAA